MEPSLRQALTWYYFIPRSGPDGRAWYARFLAGQGMETCLALEGALELAKRKRWEESTRLLAGIERDLRARRERFEPALRLVLKRHSLGVQAYLRYGQGHYPQAVRLLAAASAAALQAIERAPFLLTLASSEYEFCLHRARIARNQRRWAEMKTFLDLGRAMVRTEAPLCRLPGGREVFLADLDAVHRGLTPQSPLEAQALDILTDAPLRRAEFESSARGIELLGTVVTPFR
jgi:hypothetical protein